MKFQHFEVERAALIKKDNRLSTMNKRSREKQITSLREPIVAMVVCFTVMTNVMRILKISIAFCVMFLLLP